MNIKMLVMDVDGTLTDGKIYIGINGEIMKAFNVRDGLGINKLHNRGILPVIITGRKSDIVYHRAEELGIKDVYQDESDKIFRLKQVANQYNCDYNEIAFIGDDENDLECMKLCGYKGCPANAERSIKVLADFICNCNGGDGAVREFIEYLLPLMDEKK